MANYWSPDGTRAISLRRDSLEFGLSVWYPDGGSSGSTLTLDPKYGMTAIHDVVWDAEGEDAMLIGGTAGRWILVPYHTVDGSWGDAFTAWRYAVTDEGQLEVSILE